jgi:hypothetical protein
MSVTTTQQTSQLPKKDHPLFYVLKQQATKAKKLAVLSHGMRAKGDETFPLPNGSLKIMFYIPEGYKMNIIDPNSGQGKGINLFPIIV